MAINIPIITSFDAKGITKAITDFRKLETGAAKAGFALTSIDKGATQIVRGLGKMAMGAALAGAVVGKVFVNEAYKAQKVMAETNAIIASTKGAANISAQGVKELSDKLSLQIGVDDKLIQKSANLLLTFKQVQNQAGKGNDIFTQSVIAAQDLGYVFGDADSAAKQLGKALSDPIAGMTALKRVGINFTATQKDQIKTLVKTGDLLSAQKLILGEVESQVGGTAAATATGLDRMKVGVKNIQESIGGLLIPVVEHLATSVTNNLVPTMQTFTNVVGSQGVASGFEYLSGKVINALTGMGTFGKVVLGVAGAFVTLKVATLTYTTVLGAMNIAAEVLNTTLASTEIALTAAGGVAALLGVAAIAYGFYASRKAQATDATAAFADALKLEGDAQQDALVKLYKTDQGFADGVDTLTRFGFTLQDVKKYVDTGSSSMDDLTAAADKWISTGINLTKVGEGSSQEISNQTLAIENFRMQFPQLQNATSDQILAFLRLIATMHSLRDDSLRTTAALGVISGGLANAGNAAADAAGQFSDLDWALFGAAVREGEMAKQTHGAGGAVKTAAEKLKDYITALRSWDDNSRSLIKSTKDISAAQKEQTQATIDVAKAQEHFNHIAKGYSASSNEAIDATNKLADAQRKLEDSNRSVADAQDAVVAAQKRLDDLNQPASARSVQTATDTLTEAQFRLADAQAELEKIQRRQNPNQRALVEAQINVRNATNDVTDAQAALTDVQDGASPEEMAAAQRDLSDAQRSLTDKLADQVIATQDVNTAQSELNTVLNGATSDTDAYREALKQLNDAKDAEVAASEAVTEAVRAERDAKYQLAEAEDALAAAQKKAPKNADLSAFEKTGIMSPALKAQFDKIDWAGLGKMISGRATGGSVMANTPYIVGERGSELFVPDTNGTIIPNGASASAQQMNIIVNVSGSVTTERQLVEQIRVGLLKAQKSGRATVL